MSITNSKKRKKKRNNFVHLLLKIKNFKIIKECTKKKE
jgi:hypothetical protein